MSEELNRLHVLVGALARRERALLLWQSALRSAALLAAVLLGACVTAWQDLSRPAAVAGLVLLGGVGAWFLVGAPWVTRWRRAGDPLRQARLLEALDPALRGRLITAVARRGGPRGAESPELLALVVRRALAAAEKQDPVRVHPALGVRRWSGLTAGAWILAVVGLLGGPIGGDGVWRWWFGGAEAVAALAPVVEGEADVAARVGDLTLRYVYPAYTGLEPYLVSNSTGEAHAPPGTRVEVLARSANPVEAASLVAYDQPATDAAVQEGRVLSGSFVVRAEPGTYHIVTHGGGTTQASKRFPIVPDADLPPEVTLVGPDRVVEIAVDGLLDLRWDAKDDYGISRVVLEIDGEEHGAPLKVPRERVAALGDRYLATPSDLGMEPGGTYELVVAAWDNDTVSGRKVGRSNVLRLMVLGEGGTSQLSRDLRMKLLDLLLAALAGQLEDTFPPGRASGDFARWGETVNARYAPVAAFVDEHRGARSREPVWPPVEAALDDGRTLVRYSQVSFVPGSAERANATSAQAVGGFRDTAIASLEAAVLHVDAILYLHDIRELARETETLTAVAEDVRDLLAVETPDTLAMQMAVSNVQEYLQRIEALSSTLPDGGLRSFVEARTQEAMRQADQVREALQRKDVPDARKLMDRVSQRLSELSSGIREELERMAERSQEQEGQGEDVLKKLAEVRDGQLQLASEVQRIEEQGGADFRRQVADLWRRIEQQAEAVHEQLGRFGQEIEAAHRPFNEQIFVDEAVERAGSARDAAVARDLAGLERQVIDLEAHWSRYAARNLRLIELGHVTAGPGRDRIRAVDAAIRDLLALVEQLRRRDQVGDPGVRQQVQRLEAQQRQLQGELDAAAQQARELAQQLAVTPRALMPALEGAAQRMRQAGDQLGRGDAMQARGSQQAAGSHVDEAIRALQDAMQQAAAQSAGGEQESGGGGGEDREEGEGKDGQRSADGQGHQPIKLPEPEEFRTPEAYRRALLEGMEGDVPEEYRALKRRYYEELVHQ